MASPLLNHLLSIPLLVDEIASPLDIAHLSSAVRVCKTWQEVFEPWLWRTAFIDNQRSTRILDSHAYRATARKHRDYIKEVQVDSPRLFQELWSNLNPTKEPLRPNIKSKDDAETPANRKSQELITPLILVENRLTVLEWSHDYHLFFTGSSVEALVIILKASPHLISFGTNNFPFLMSNRVVSLMSAIPRRTQYLRLGTTQGTARSDTVALVLTLCPITVLSLEIQWTAIAPSHPDDLSFYSQFAAGPDLCLRKLVLSNCNYMDLDAVLVPLMHRAPQLRVLNFSNRPPSAPMDLVLETLRNRTCVHLDQLFFRFWQSSPKLMSMMEAFPTNTLRQLVIHNDFSGSVELVLLLADRQAQSLERIEVLQGQRLHCKDLDLAPLFYSCPRLRSVRYLIYRGKSAEDRYYGIDFRALLEKPWVCTQLQELEALITDVPRPDLSSNWTYWQAQRKQMSEDRIIAGVIVNEGESHLLQKKFFRQLGRCRQLSILNLGRSGSMTLKFNNTPTQIKALEFSIQSGLNELAGLTRLRELGISRLSHGINIGEVQWMAEHWPSLGIVTGLKRLKTHTRPSKPRWIKEIIYPRSDTDESDEALDPVLWLRGSRPEISLLED